MCYKAIVENGGTLEPVPDCYRNHQMCDKVVDNYLHALEFVPNCYKTPKMCFKVDNRISLNLFVSLMDIKPKKCVTVMFLKNFLLVYCPNRYKTQRCVMKPLMIVKQH